MTIVTHTPENPTSPTIATMRHRTKARVLGLLVFAWTPVAVVPRKSPWGAAGRALLPVRLARRGHGADVSTSPRTDNLDVVVNFRGGAGAGGDEERYSRQVYTLGARAHGLVRSATVILDGPTESGLMYECAKNLALSGVGSIVVMSDDHDASGTISTATTESLYFNAELDDLGKAYGRAARAELGYDATTHDDSPLPKNVLVEFIKRLNPSVQVSHLCRSDLLSSTIKGRAVLVAVDRPQSTQVALNDMCRERELAFVSIETAGVYGRVFCDFGESFEVVDTDGETPMAVPLDHVETVHECDTLDKLVVHVMEGEMHDVSKDDTIRFQMSSGEPSLVDCTVLHVDNPRRFSVRCSTEDPVDFAETVNRKGTSFSRVKRPHCIQFLPLRDSLQQSRDNESLFTPCDLDKSFDPVRRSALLASFESIESFICEHMRLPSKQDTKAFRHIAQECTASPLSEEKQWKSTVKSFCETCAAKLTPIQAILGAIGSQEVLKAVSGLYNPVRQFLLYDCEELLESCNNARDDGVQAVASGQSYILGQAFCEDVSQKRVFVVGAGAIGCELLKNLSAMGVAHGEGKIVLTDMDTIEQSNLSRQLLFRDSDIGKFKSSAAHDAVRKFDPSIQIETHTSKVGGGEHGPFRSNFWRNEIDVVLNALDNMEARLFIDGQCVANGRALVDAGTLGSKGNVQVVVPFQSESYGSSIDPPDPAIPLCTIKHFPYSISHTIQWGRELFDGYFQRRPKQANDRIVEFSSMGAERFLSRLTQELGEEEAHRIASELAEDWKLQQLVGGSIELRKHALEWAVHLARGLFWKSIQDLLEQHPVDSRDEEGEPFWSGARRTPKPLALVELDPSDTHQTIVNDNLVEFVRQAARLRVEMVHAAPTVDHSSFSREAAVEALRNSWSSSNTTEGSSSLDVSYDSSQLKIIQFEKDDDTNGHVALVTAASNLRALCYGIAPVDAMETRRVAGRIVPAMISTTALVSALSCIEFLKLLQKAPLASHRNAFVNLALPFFAFTRPLPAEEIEGLAGASYTIWDRIVVKEKKSDLLEGGLSLRSFLKRVTKKTGINPDSIAVASVSYGPYLIFANFLHGDDEELMAKPLVELIEEAIAIEVDDDFAGREGKLSRAENSANGVETVSSYSSIELTMIVEDLETGDEVELPPLVLQRRSPGGTE